MYSSLVLCWSRSLSRALTKSLSPALGASKTHVALCTSTKYLPELVVEGLASEEGVALMHGLHGAIPWRVDGIVVRHAILPKRQLGCECMLLEIHTTVHLVKCVHDVALLPNPRSKLRSWSEATEALPVNTSE